MELFFTWAQRSAQNVQIHLVGGTKIVRMCPLRSLIVCGAFNDSPSTTQCFSLEQVEDWWKISQMSLAKIFTSSPDLVFVPVLKQLWDPAVPDRSKKHCLSCCVSVSKTFADLWLSRRGLHDWMTDVNFLFRPERPLSAPQAWHQRTHWCTDLPLSSSFFICWQVFVLEGEWSALPPCCELNTSTLIMQHTILPDKKSHSRHNCWHGGAH